MRLIDADALKELFSEVIGHITKKPEMNGNLEHMIRASAMVIQMIDDAPSVQPDTTVHDSIPAETGKNNGDRTSGDCISRRASLEKIRTMQTYKLFAGDDMILIDKAQVQTELMMLPPVQPEQRWIPCSVRLPEDDTEVLVYLFEDNKSPYIAWLSDGRWYTEDFEVEQENEPVAWMPLPEPYQEKGEQE